MEDGKEEERGTVKVVDGKRSEKMSLLRKASYPHTTTFDQHRASQLNPL